MKVVNIKDWYKVIMPKLYYDPIQVSTPKVIPTYENVLHPDHAHYRDISEALTEFTLNEMGMLGEMIMEALEDEED